MRIFSFIISFLFITSACSKDPDEIITMPLYKECIDTVLNYQSEFNEEHKDTKTRLNAEIKYFNYKRFTLPGIVGWITLSGKNLDIDLELFANEIAHNCYPHSSISVDNHAHGYRRLNKDYQHNTSRGIKHHYLFIEGDQLIMHFNDQADAE